MKITFRLIFGLLISLTTVVVIFSYFSVQSERQRLITELEHRSFLVAATLKEGAARLIESGPSKKLDAMLQKLSSSGRVMGIVIYNPLGEIISSASEKKEMSTFKTDIINEIFEGDAGKGKFESLDSEEIYLYAIPLFNEGEEKIATLVILNDASYIKSYLTLIWKRNFLRLLLNAIAVSVVSILVIRWSLFGPIAKMADWIKGIRKGEGQNLSKDVSEELFAPLSKEISKMAKSLAVARMHAEEEAKLRQKQESIWTAERLREHVKTKLGESKFVVISNREPYMHLRKGRQVECISPASGLVTAIEPVLRASGGTWIAHGGGNADRETVNKQSIIKVPPDNPQYELKRIWLTKDEEEGYYYGFSNEGLWPLCHIAHTRPIFRPSDWTHYKEVNFKFARGLDETIENDSCVFIQDYHFALLPRIIKDRHSDVRVAQFWHIPWPNPEAFGICPWKREILHGMLGNDLLGFHTQFHCNNFLETVDRILECRIDWDHFSVSRLGHTTFVKPFPISIDTSPPTHSQEIISKAEILKNMGIKASIMGMGVDRIDYTKGILERFRAVERFFEKYPEYIGMMTFVQLGAPSREHIKTYHDFITTLEVESDRVNWKFQTSLWKPIAFLKKHFSHSEIEPYYRASDFCMVTSLHDGMNLVSKEFVSSREDEKGVLILSTFTGASKELKDAVLVNPYDIEQMAGAIKTAIEMDEKEKSLRMKRMRETIRENNIYKWAANIISEISQLRTENKTQ